MVVFFSVLLLLSGISLIITVLLQENKSEGLGAIGGGTEKLWGRSGARTKEAMLMKITTVSAIVFMISALVIAAIE
jgi:preprotein translocase subunit SecG